MVQFAAERRIRLFRTVLASLLGAMASTGILLLQIGFGVRYLLIMLATALAMCCIVDSCRNLRDTAVHTVWYFTLSIAFVWLLGLATYTDSSLGLGSILSVLALLAGVLLFIRYNSKQKTIDMVCRAEIAEQGKRVEVRAFFDTGNSLKEPFSRKPVSIIEKELVEEIWQTKKPEERKTIPFHSIGTKHGILQGMVVEELVIWKEDRKITWKKAIVAIYDGSLSQDGSFQMILHPKLNS